MEEIKITSPTMTPSQVPISSAKKIAVTVFVGAIILAGVVYAFAHKTSVPVPTPTSTATQTPTATPTPKKTISLENTEVYSFAVGDFAFSFHYPKNYCTSQDIGTVTVLYKTDCEKTAASASGNGMSIVTFPDADGQSKTTAEFVASLKAKGYNDTGGRRTIGGYTAYKLKDSKSNEYAWVFLTKYHANLGDADSMANLYWSVIIIPHLETQPGGLEAQEIVLNSFAFGK